MQLPATRKSKVRLPPIKRTARKTPPPRAARKTPLKSTAETTAENGQNAQSACQDAAYAQSANPGQNADTQYAGTILGMPGVGAYPTRRPLASPTGVLWSGGYGAPYGQYGNRPYNGYYHTPLCPRSTVAAGVRDSHTAVRTVQHPQGQGYGVPYGQPPVNPLLSKMPQTEQILPLPQRTDRNLKKRMSKGLIAFICVACCVTVGVVGLSIGIIAGKALGEDRL